MILSFENHLPLPSLDIVTTGQTGAWGVLAFTAEARSVKLIDAVGAPDDANAWCYIRRGSPQESAGKLENYLGPVINVERGRPLKTVWINKLPSMPPARAGDARALAMPPIHPFPMEFGEKNAQFKSMNYSAGVVTHLHGGKVQPGSDGWPLEPASYEGNPFRMPSHREYLYPNEQRAAMLWFHDHGMDNTAPQVHAGLAGVYFIRDGSDAEIFHFIGGPDQEIPLVIQDRCFAEPSETQPAFPPSITSRASRSRGNRKRAGPNFWAIRSSSTAGPGPMRIFIRAFTGCACSTAPMRAAMRSRLPTPSEDSEARSGMAIC